MACDENRVDDVLYVVDLKLRLRPDEGTFQTERSRDPLHLVALLANVLRVVRCIHRLERMAQQPTNELNTLDT